MIYETGDKMLIDLFRSGFDKFSVVQILLLIPVILISLSVHEYAHGYAAMKLGDNTARNLGRLSLNPLSHIDPVGFVFLLLFGFGWAKPVPVNMRNVKKGRFGFLAVALAGPFSNIILALLGAVVFNLFIVVESYVSISETLSLVIYLFFAIFVQLNVTYSVFNMIPVPPLDGSRIITAIIPRRFAEWVFRYERFIQIILIILLFRGAFSGVLSTAVGHMTRVIYSVVGLIPFELLMK